MASHLVRPPSASSLSSTTSVSTSSSSSSLASTSSDLACSSNSSTSSASTISPSTSKSGILPSSSSSSAITTTSNTNTISSSSISSASSAHPLLHRKRVNPFSSLPITVSPPSKKQKHPLHFSSSPPNSSLSPSTSVWHMPLSTLTHYLHFLEKDQLISLLLHLSQTPALQSLLTEHLPKPTVSFILKHLHQLERKWMEAFPYTRPSERSSSLYVFNDYAFNRVRPILYDLQSTLLNFLDYFFHLSKSFTTTIPSDDASLHDFILFLYESTQMVCRLPDFEKKKTSSFHDLHPFKKTLLETLKQYWRNAVGLIQAHHVDTLTSSEWTGFVEKWLKCLEDVNTTSHGYFQDLLMNFEPWVRALHHASFRRSTSGFLPCGILHHSDPVTTPPPQPTTTTPTGWEGPVYDATRGWWGGMM